MLEWNATEPSSVVNTTTPALPSLADHKRKKRPPSNPFPPIWTYEQFCFLRDCWADGMSGRKSAAAVNEKFGTNFSRSATIAKARREGLPPNTANRGGRIAGPQAPRKPRAPVVEDATDQLIPFEQRKTLHQLEHGICKWPVGHPGEPNFFFCGGKSLETAPYCAGHSKRAYGYTKERSGIRGFNF